MGSRETVAANSTALETKSLYFLMEMLNVLLTTDRGRYVSNPPGVFVLLKEDFDGTEKRSGQLRRIRHIGAENNIDGTQTVQIDKTSRIPLQARDCARCCLLP
jgi:hypothetical protein